MLTEKNMLCAWHCMCVLPKYRGVSACMRMHNACIFRDLQKTKSRKWYQQIKKVTKSGRSELRLNINGVQDDDEKGKADAVNDIFTNVSAHVPLWILLSYLLICQPKTLHLSCTPGKFTLRKSTPQNQGDLIRFLVKLWRNLYMWSIISKGTLRSAVNIMYYGPLKFDKVKNLIQGQISNSDINSTFIVYLINLIMFLHQNHTINELKLKMKMSYHTEVNMVTVT